MTFHGLLAGMMVAVPALRAFDLPTDNKSLFEANGGERFFVGTAGKPWTSGQFGCVRSEGRQLHEGLDIRCVHRDRRGEPADAVRASADGVVVHANTRPALSNYGNYLVVRHQIDGIEIHTLYAHLSAIAPGIAAGSTVRTGQTIATMGRTSNTRQSITRDRAHVHFEIDFRTGERYAEWHRTHQGNLRNDHGEYNGHNLVGIDPAPVLAEQHRLGAAFSLARHLAAQPETLRVFVRDPAFPWARRFAGLVRKNPATDHGGIAGYELHLAFNGAPLRIIPRTAAEVPGNARLVLLGVNEQEFHSHPCCRLVFRQGTRWVGLPALDDLVSIAETR